MKIWHISDTHGNHNKLEVPDVDLIIHSGDATNYRDVGRNFEELLDFIGWFQNIDIPKIYVAGNHDTSLEAKWWAKDEWENSGIIYLEHESIEYEGIKIFGSPYSPSFGYGWAYNKSRTKIDRVWNEIPDDTDILITHSPPKGILDITENRDRTYEFCGCSALKKQIQKRIKPKIHMFGHIHNRRNAPYNNVGIFKKDGITYSNAAVSIDGNITNICSNGNIITLD